MELGNLVGSMLNGGGGAGAGANPLGSLLGEGANNNNILSSLLSSPEGMQLAGSLLNGNGTGSNGIILLVLALLFLGGQRNGLGNFGLNQIGNNGCGCKNGCGCNNEGCTSNHKKHHHHKKC